MKVKKVNSCYTRYDNCTRCSKTLEDIVCILDHHSHDQTPKRLQTDDGPHYVVIAEKEAFLRDFRPVVDFHGDYADHRSYDSQLDVSQPDALIGSFQDFLKVDSSESREAALDQDSYQSQQGALLHGDLALGGVGGLDLDQGHPTEQDEEGQPLEATQGLTQH